MFRVYLRTHDQQVDMVSKTNTNDAAVAAAAFAALVAREDLDSQRIAAVLSHDGGQLAFHRFDHLAGSSDYWRGRLNEIEWPVGVTPAVTDNAPTPERVRATRVAAGMTQRECAERMGYVLRSWQNKEDAGASGRALSTGEFELLQLLAGEHPEYMLIPR